jgi:hypothetical protein
MLIVRVATVGLLGLAAVSALARAPSIHAAGGNRGAWARSEKPGNVASAGTKSNVTHPVHLALTN